MGSYNLDYWFPFRTEKRKFLLKVSIEGALLYYLRKAVSPYFQEYGKKADNLVENIHELVIKTQKTINRLNSIINKLKEKGIELREDVTQIGWNLRDQLGDLIAGTNTANSPRFRETKREITKTIVISSTKEIKIIQKSYNFEKLFPNILDVLLMVIFSYFIWKNFKTGIKNWWVKRKHRKQIEVIVKKEKKKFAKYFAKKEQELDVRIAKVEIIAQKMEQKQKNTDKLMAIMFSLQRKGKLTPKIQTRIEQLFFDYKKEIEILTHELNLFDLSQKKDITGIRDEIGRTKVTARKEAEELIRVTA